MSSDKCPHCGGLTGHTPVDQAACAYRVATTVDIKRVASEAGASEVAAADLIAHLRAALSDAEAYRVARYVFELGWRPGVSVR